MRTPKVHRLGEAFCSEAHADEFALEVAALAGQDHNPKTGGS